MTKSTLSLFRFLRICVRRRLYLFLTKPNAIISLHSEFLFFSFIGDKEIVVNTKTMRKPFHSFTWHFFRNRKQITTDNSHKDNGALDSDSEFTKPKMNCNVAKRVTRHDNLFQVSSFHSTWKMVGPPLTILMHFSQISVMLLLLLSLSPLRMLSVWTRWSVSIFVIK